MKTASLALDMAAPWFAPRRIAGFTALVFSLIGACSLRAAPSAPAWAATPATPGNTTMLLDWNSANGAATYRVRYRTSDSTETWTTITGLPTTPTNYTVTALTNQKSYEFQVGATNSSNVTTWGTVWHMRPRGLIHTSGLPAGGQVNVIVKAAAGFMVAGADVSGFQRSADGGITWRQSAKGVHIDNGTHACTGLAYDSGSGTVFGLTGGGGMGHFFTSTDNGASWTHKSSGANLYAVATGSSYPRNVGKLVAVDPSNANIVYVGTDSNGVQKSTNGGSSWTTLVLAGKQVNGLALSGGFLYAAVGGTGVYRCTPSGGSLTKFTGTGSPTNPEELLVLGGNLYAAANTAGIRRLSNASTAGATATWTNLGVGSSTAMWCAIDGYISGTNHVIVVGNSEAEQLGATGRYTTVMKCTNAQASSGFNWVNISSASTNTVAVDPNNPGRVYVGDSDHCLWISDDYGETMTYVTEPTNSGGKPICFDLDVDVNGLIYVALEGPGGGIWTHNRSNQTWTEVAGANGSTLRSLTGGPTLHGVAVKHISGTRVILAAAEGSGLWRLEAGGNWTRVQSTTMSGVGTSVKTMSFAWSSTNNQLVFFYDQSTGVWRSTNAGQTWTNIWSTGFSSQFTGSLALRTNTSQLFVSTDAGLRRLDNADTASNPPVTNLDVPNAGKLTARGDTVWCASSADSNGTTLVKLHRSTDGTNFTAFTSGYYQGAAGRVSGVAADAVRQYITAGSQGIAVSDN